MAIISAKTQEACRVAAWNATYGKKGQDATDAAADAVLAVVLVKLNDLEERFKNRGVSLPERMEA